MAKRKKASTEDKPGKVSLDDIRNLLNKKAGYKKAAILGQEDVTAIDKDSLISTGS